MGEYSSFEHLQRHTCFEELPEDMPDNSPFRNSRLAALADSLVYIKGGDFWQMKSADELDDNYKYLAGFVLKKAGNYTLNACTQLNDLDVNRYVTIDSKLCFSAPDST